MEKTQLKKFDNFDDDPEEYLRYAWIAFTVHIDKPRGLWYAYNGKKFLNEQQIQFENETLFYRELYKKCMGYHIVAMLYVWNNWFDEAFEIEEYFLANTYWHPIREQIEQYLEMLIIKRRSVHLGKLFDNPEFQYSFLTYFEVYYSLFLDPTLTITKMSEFVQLINKINKLCRGYNEPDFLTNPAL